jgi:hypothetical protein
MGTLATRFVSTLLARVVGISMVPVVRLAVVVNRLLERDF